MAFAEAQPAAPQRTQLRPLRVVDGDAGEPRHVRERVVAAKRAQVRRLRRWNRHVWPHLVVPGRVHGEHRELVASARPFVDHGHVPVRNELAVGVDGQAEFLGLDHALHERSDGNRSHRELRVARVDLNQVFVLAVTVVWPTGARQSTVLVDASDVAVLGLVHDANVESKRMRSAGKRCPERKAASNAIPIRRKTQEDIVHFRNSRFRRTQAAVFCGARNVLRFRVQAQSSWQHTTAAGGGPHIASSTSTAHACWTRAKTGFVTIKRELEQFPHL
ncbi:hypothetical protein H257_07101 [Aphanomyces astaci]|uniref:Uncharacterized protein n=1 Tax=Aphanomyces astaci TaxID=112090 RepID=W4GJK9_APHAT|nr:hypothetical protein H257_07101 [Aphanomyces astaci]ETV79890.1 hypothetical protein H257_07101 [Aphanomyces astaci]|eukprot:XP_009830826.1 hypothetical protein H257_07101 [Aphanomyces astaci]